MCAPAALRVSHLFKLLHGSLAVVAGQQEQLMKRRKSSATASCEWLKQQSTTVTIKRAVFEQFCIKRNKSESYN